MDLLKSKHELCAVALSIGFKNVCFNNKPSFLVALALFMFTYTLESIDQSPPKKTTLGFTWCMHAKSLQSCLAL